MGKTDTKTKPKPTTETLYQNGYDAFEQGNYEKAIELARQCLDTAPDDSYWYPAALALRCWAANWTNDTEMAVRDAYLLLSMDSGEDKMWFDGAALLNIGLIRRRNGDNQEADILFQLASERYGAYEIESDKPAEWPFIRDMFAAACHWAAQNTTDKLRVLADSLKEYPDKMDKLEHVRRAVDLYLRAAEGKDVSTDAESAVSKGVSRTFLSPLLL